MLKMPHKSEYLPIDEAVRIKCRFCDLKDICPARARKERYEAEGWMTKCVMTPNRPGKTRKAKKRKKTDA